LDDTALVEGLRARDATAQAVFWRRYFEIVYPISAHILGTGPDAVDAAVDLLVDFTDDRVHRLSSPKALYAYLRLAAVRRAIRYRDWRVKNISIGDCAVQEPGITPEESAGLSTLMPRLDECLKVITPKAQETLRLKYVSQLTNEHIGRLLGGSKQYIGQLIQKSLAVLRKCLEAKDGDSEGNP
jgi:RNA polymerase sigma factor (sigma-70 family)